MCFVVGEVPPERVLLREGHPRMFPNLRRTHEHGNLPLNKQLSFFTTSHVGAALTGGYWAPGGMSTRTVRGGRSAIGTQKQYNRCKQGAGKPGGHRPPCSQSNGSDM